MNYVEVAVPFFILAMLLEFLYGWWRKKQTYRLNDTINSLSLGVLSRVVDLLRLGFAGIVFGAVAGLFGITVWSMESWWQWVVVFVAYDFCYYWKHRMGHEWRIFWASHVAHHQSEEFNLSTALRQTGTDYLGFVFYIPLYFLGMPAEAVVTVGSLNLIYQFWVHTEHVPSLGPVEWVFVTPSNHRVHHARNPEYLDKNYGGVFILWDRIFGTFCAEKKESRCVYGITTGLHSWNPLWANLHVWADTGKLAWKTKRLRDKCLIWFKAPGWMPDDLAIKADYDYQAPKYDPPLSPGAKIYTFIQFWALTGLSLWLLDIQKDFSWIESVALFLWFMVAMMSLGVLLENKAYAFRFETVRLAVTVVIGAGLYLFASEPLVVIGSFLTVYAVISGILAAFAFRHNDPPLPNPSPEP